MSKEKPTDDPRQQTDWGSHKQTGKPWKGNPEKEHLAMVIAGAVAGSICCKPAFSAGKLHQEQRLPPDVLPKMVGRRHDGTAAPADREFN